MTAYSSAVEGDGASGNGSQKQEHIGGVPVETTVRQTSSATASSWGVRETGRLEREYRDALDRPSSYDIQIDLDVPRTISGHIMFRTRYGAG